MKKKLLGLMFGFCLMALALVLPAQCLGFNVNLEWNESVSPDVAFYTIYYGTAPGLYAHAVFSTTPSTGEVLNLPDNVMHYFAVACTDVEGLESGYSNEVFSDGTILDGQPPAPPSGCYITSVTP